MIFDKNNGQIVYDAGGAQGTRLYEAEGNEYVMLSIDPGGGIPEHSLPLAVSFCVLKGSGICCVNGTEYELSESQMIECPPDAPRSWNNPTDSILEILVVKRSAS